MISHRLYGPIALAACMSVGQAGAETLRSDYRVSSEPGIEVFVREVRPSRATNGVAVLLIHGGGPGGLASFDLPVPGYSLAQDLAEHDHAVYVMDVRGWAGSTRPPAMNEPAVNNTPAVPVEEAARDIGAVVDWIRARRGRARVALFGWASGGHWAAFYTARNNDKVSHLMMLNSLYSVDAPWSLRAAFEDPNEPGRFNARAGAYRASDANALLARWNRSIPAEDKTLWREAAVAEAYVREALASDSQAGRAQDRPTQRTPIAFQREAYNMSRGQKYWDARDLRVPTLVLRGALDFWSRPEDLAALERELVNAPVTRFVTIPGATHYLFNDRPERGRQLLLDELTGFLAASDG